MERKSRMSKEEEKCRSKSTIPTANAMSPLASRSSCASKQSVSNLLRKNSQLSTKKSFLCCANVGFTTLEDAIEAGGPAGTSMPTLGLSVLIDAIDAMLAAELEPSVQLPALSGVLERMSIAFHTRCTRCRIIDRSSTHRSN